MSGSTYLLYVKATGHGVAAATAVAVPAQDPTPEALAGPSLPVRYIDPSTTPPELEVHIPADQLAVLSVDPKALSLNDTRTTIVLADKSLSPVDVTNTMTTPPLFVSGTTNKLHVTFPVKSPDKLTIWARIQPLGPPQLVTDPEQLAAASRTASAPYTPPSPFPTSDKIDLDFEPLSTTGFHSVLVLVSGVMPSLNQVKL